MTTDRLTRQELSWLLAQEAKSAAALLRKGVDSLKKSLPPAAPPDGVEISTTLDALDDTMRALASLNVGSAAHGRRGRIDVAALLLELAPGAKVELEPGKGTEVFGDELEVRRMLQLLLALGDATAEASIRREDDAIRTSVLLGPDSSGGTRTEHAFLHRMATRHGGRLELDGSHVVLILPADPDIERREVEELRKELAAAQEQGEAYARELAEMFTKSDPPPPVATSALGGALAAVGAELVKGREPKALGAALSMCGALPADEPRVTLTADATRGVVADGTLVGPAAWMTALAALVRAEGASATLRADGSALALEVRRGLTTAVAEALGLTVSGAPEATIKL